MLQGLRRFFGLVAELIKAPRECILPDRLLQGFEELVRVDDRYTQSNTSDHNLI